MTELVEKYMEAKIISNKYYDDAFHIAIATISKVDDWLVGTTNI